MIWDQLSELNWLAVVVGTVAWFVWSAIWYSVPPISKAWQKAAKVSPAEGASMAKLLIPTYVGYFVTVVVIAMLAAAVGTADVVDAIGLGVALGVGFGVVNAMVTQLYEQKGGAYWLINGVNAIVAFSIVAVVVTLMD